MRGRHGWTCAPRKLNTREGPTSRCTRHVVRNRQPEERGKDARNHSSVEAPTPRRTGRVNLTSELPDGTPLRSHAPRFSLPPTRVALSTAREAAKDGRQDKGEKEARDAGHRWLGECAAIVSSAAPLTRAHPTLTTHEHPGQPSSREYHDRLDLESEPHLGRFLHRRQGEGEVCC